jgi:hypothetical protein
MSSIAVFFVLGGATAFAATKIGANEIKANSIKTGKIVKEAVTAGKIKAGAVTSGKLGAGSVTAEKLADNSVTTTKIADLAVTGAKLGNESVTSGKLGNGAVTAGKIGSGAVGRSNLSQPKLVPQGIAAVNSGGTIVAALSEGIPNASHPSAGIYCFDLPFTPSVAQAVVRSDTEPNDLASANVVGFTSLSNCPASADLEVTTWDTESNAFSSEAFFVTVW